MAPLAVYVHTPFCPTKCGYCDFNSFAMSGPIQGRVSSAIEREIAASPTRGTPANSIFFGGGTPTYLSALQLTSLLRATLAAHPPTDECEITSEANPGTADADKFAAMRGAGFNRLSLGAQSFRDDDLARLGRVHRASEIERAVMLARDAGFQNLNLDLMFALPGQTVADWRSNLERAFELGTEHLSLYCLTLEPNTPFSKEHRAGRLTLPEEELQVEMYDLAVDLASEAGYLQYEISNFARPGFECRHSLAYWRCEQYAGYGPGAVGRLGLPIGPTRYTNLKHPRAYAEAVERGERLWCESEALTEENLRMEKILLGLRLDEGLDSQGLDLSEEALRSLEERAWIRRTEGQIQLTRAGKHFCSEVALALC